MDDPGVLGAGDVDAAAAVGIDQVVGDEGAAGVDLVEDAAAAVVVGDVADDAILGVLGVEPDAVGGDVVGGLAADDGAAAKVIGRSFSPETLIWTCSR